MIKDNKKWCPDCDDWIPVSRFHKNKSAADGYSHYCGAHKNARRRNRYKDDDEYRNNINKYNNTRYANDEAFRQRKAAYNKQYYKDNKEYLLAQHAEREAGKDRRKYFNGHQRAQRMRHVFLSKQGGMCWYCDEPLSPDNETVELHMKRWASRGGDPDDMDNYVLVHRGCHNKIHSKYGQTE